jgi:hypothetical protein
MKLFHFGLAAVAVWAAYSYGCKRGKDAGKAEAQAKAAGGEQSPAGKANGT